MGNFEHVEYKGYNLKALRSRDGEWIGEFQDLDIPQLAAETREDLVNQFHIVVDTLIENETVGTGAVA